MKRRSRRKYDDTRTSLPSSPYSLAICLGENVTQDDSDSDQTISSPIFVPASADGSYFSPDLRMEKGYQIGVEGKERFVEDFDEALDQLTKMSPPTWRRPSATSDRLGRVVSTKWVRVTREELFQ